MSAFIIRPKTKKDAEIAEAFLRKMRIPIEKIDNAPVSGDEEEVVPFSVFVAELERRIRKHFKVADGTGVDRETGTRTNKGH